MNQHLMKLRSAAIIAAMAVPGFMRGQGGYVTGDFHQHTHYTDGSYTIGHMMEKNNYFGLDWWANSEHGGGFNRWGMVSGDDIGTTVTWDKTGVALKGKANGNNMWRWQSLTEWSFTDILLYRRIFPNKLIIQAYEMNVPTHEHASMGLIGNQFAPMNPDVNALALFEYLFDASDSDDSQPFGTTETKMANNHTKAVASVAWLQANYPTQSWVIPAHPERYRYSGSTGWNIEHFRDLNNAAPDVFFGFESFPGHQMSAARGEYGNASARPPLGSYGLCTYGGCGWMSAKVGGLWDAMLSEGRHFWLFANSDCHNNADGAGDFFPGEYQKTYTYVTQKNNAQAVVDGLRSGNSYAVSGDLIDSLTFTIGTVQMGSTHNTTNSTVEVYIKVRNPQQDNNNRYGNYKRPNLDHIDLIAGVVTGKVSSGLSAPPADGQTGYSAAYKQDTVSTTKVIARFGASAATADPNGIATTAWTDLGNGWKEIRYTANLTDGGMYFRLRGTNLALNTANETDACGNPLPDTLVGANTAEKAFADLWFYSNPIFVETTNPSLSSNYIRINEISTNGSTQYTGLDWVELYNSSNHDIKLTGFTLDDAGSENAGTTAKLDSITVPAKGYKILVETVHFPFGLSRNDDRVVLKKNGNMIDRIIYNVDIADKTLGRIEDGIGSTDATYSGTEIGGWKVYNDAEATIGASNNTITFIYTSDQHYGITRAAFRGQTTVNATVVNAAMVSQINKLNGINLPQDGEVNSGKRMNINYIIATGDFSNRAETGIPTAKITYPQFTNDYVNGITLKDFKGNKPVLLLAPGNHDVSNTVGHKNIHTDSVDNTAMVEIYNHMFNPTPLKTTATYNYDTDKINYIKNIGGIQFVFVNMWLDLEGRQWISNNMNTSVPAFIFTHDQPAVEAKHFTDPTWTSGPFNFANSFEYLLTQKSSQPASNGSTATEQRELATFINNNPNIKAYFHGNDNENEFYTYTGPDNNIGLPTFRVDSPMKGNKSASNESVLSFHIVSIDKNTKTMTVRECLWNTTANANAPIVFGESKTINY